MRGSCFLAVAATALSGCAGTGPSSGGGKSQPTYLQPVAVDSAEGKALIAASKKGHLVGVDTQALSPLYWNSPTSAPVVLKNGGLPSVVPYGVNDSGQVVGASQGSAGNVPLYWPTPTDNPVVLNLPSGESQGTAFSINSTGGIVGWSGTGTTSKPIIWNSPTTPPQILLNATGGSALGVRALKIANNGQIFGLNLNGGGPVAWPSLNSPMAILPLPSGTTFTGSTDLEFPVNPETAESGGAVQSPSTIFPIYYASIADNVGIPPLPAGDTEPAILLDIGPSHQLVGNAGTKALIWTSPTTPFKDLNTLIPSGTGWHLINAQFMLDDGEIIGQGTDPSNNSTWFHIAPEP